MMKPLMMTTAVCLTMATSAFADDHMTGFMDYSVTDNDLLASEFIGMRVYSAEQDVDVTANMVPDAQTEWDDIGEINELVISPDGNVVAVIVGVGGFLGLGEKDVAMDMKQIHIMREADDADDFFLVIKSSSEALKAAPSFERDMDNAEMDAETTPRRSMLMAPDVTRDGYARTERSELTTEMLTGARVYGVDDEDVGEIHSLLLDDKGTIDRAIIDVGGFLGMGEKPVAVTFDELTVLRKDGGDDVQVYIDSSVEALKAQPTYEK
ncbi:PRC-barrel domain-containing protein [Sedimentitalea todarodis]|uniref:PRC-barrel domain-containing protein n=1 Tax=Sedimentitalea todarodis TaxID=1631240 RepID=A0ABU3VM58_9RHOB|nr:PRC-barrel domain-containing protein [Sedimentitalea todarodis]MDU9007045.1 PRC-barrel domain-containing protein [Sedimentitalea todarodis]